MREALDRVRAAAVDVIAFPFVILAALLLRALRRDDLRRYPVSNRALTWLEVLPVVRHYHEPYVDRSDLAHPLSQPRHLPDLDMNVAGQLEVLEHFTFSDELRAIPRTSSRELEFHYENEFFEGGDAEYLYSAIRHFKPRRIVEIGGGHSTLVAALAIAKNRAEDALYACDHTVIEPFENSWLDHTDATVVRQRMEQCDPSLFASLQANDILFVDTSHVVRPHGELLFLFFTVFHAIAPGVLIHIHDIFTPRDYPDVWLFEKKLLWNEQYFLEAFLSHNRNFEIVGAVNYLWNDHRDRFLNSFPMLPTLPRQNPGSFWLRKLDPH